MARHINPSNSTNKTIDAIDRKRERERQYLLKKSRRYPLEYASSRLSSRFIAQQKS